MNSFYSSKTYKNKRESNDFKGFSTIDLSITLMIISILAVMIIPNFSSALEFFEVLIAEKYLHSSVKECQSGLIENEDSPQYNPPTKDLGLGIFSKNKFSFSFTGNEGDCINYNAANLIRISRINNNQNDPKYSLIINVITGEKRSEGDLPDWLDWWEDKYSPLIPENDPLIYQFD